MAISGGSQSSEYSESPVGPALAAANAYAARQKPSRQLCSMHEDNARQMVRSEEAWTPISSSTRTVSAYEVGFTSRASTSRLKVSLPIPSTPLRP